MSFPELSDLKFQDKILTKYKQYEMQLNQLKQDKTIALEKFNFLLLKNTMVKG